MAGDIKWIKLTTDMFDDEKIDFITSLPESNAIIVIWVRLLTLAGKCNAGGFIFLTEKIPYSIEMLSNKFKQPLNVVKLAFETFRQLEMIEVDENGMIFLPNWDKHQNIEALEAYRERERIRKQEYRQRKRLSGTIVGQSQENPRLEEDIDIDIDKENNIRAKKVKYAEFVSLTEVEYQKLVDKHGEDFARRCIDVLNNYKGSKGKKYTSDYRAILNWVVDRVQEEFSRKKQRRPADHDVDLRNHEIQFQRWVNAGNDPAKFRYDPDE